MNRPIAVLFALVPAFSLACVDVNLDRDDDGEESSTGTIEQAATATIVAVADGRVEQANPNTRYGTAGDLTADIDPSVSSYVMFNVGGVSGSVTSAKLRLYVRNPSDNGPAVYATGTGWTESTLTWNTRPARLGGVVADVGAVSSGTWVEYDVTSVVRGNGTYSFELVASTTDGTIFQSREESFPPQLVVVSGTAPADAGTADSGVRDASTADSGVRDSGASAPDSGTGAPDAGPPPAGSLALTLTRASGVTGTQRVNVGVPLRPGFMNDPNQAAVRIGGQIVPTARTALARYPDGSIRSLQIQFDATASVTQATLTFGESAPALAPVAVETLLRNEALGSATVQTPRVWVTMPANHLVQSTFAGHLVATSALPADARRAWSTTCDYNRWGSSAFTPTMNSDRAVWLYDRGTAFYRGYAVTGTLGVLQTAYRETDLYRRRILSLDGTPLPGGANSDIKYNYTQNLALHYLLSGDVRFREAAEAVADRSPIAGFTAAVSSGQWTERNTGFGLLANTYAARISDDKAATYRARAETIMNNVIAIQNRSIDFSRAPAEKNLPASSRCFSHTPTQHDASEYAAGDLDGPPGTLVCSPWMTAILADGIEAYADDVGGTRRTAALDSLVRVGRRLGASDARGPSGRPHYLLGVDGGDRPDEYDEHWGEVAQVTAMAYYYAGANDTTLRANADRFVNGFASEGGIYQVRSFNWQCRSPIATPFYLP